VAGDGPTLAQQVEWAAGQPDEHVMLDLQAQAAAFGGRARAALELTRRAVERATAGDANGVAAQYAAAGALRAAALGVCPQQQAVARALSLERNQVSLSRGGLALALCGETGPAQAAADELARRHPKDTVITGLWLPTIAAALTLRRGDPERAIELLQPVRRYEAAGEFWPPYLRGQAQLRRKAAREASDEFRSITEHRGQGPLSPLYALAQAGLALASGSAEAHRDFLALWKDADAQLPALVAAREEGTGRQ
jgi:hypothetical protein